MSKLEFMQMYNAIAADDGIVLRKNDTRAERLIKSFVIYGYVKEKKQIITDVEVLYNKIGQNL